IQNTVSLACWLHGVAYRAARKAQTEFARRQKHEARVPQRVAALAADDLTWREVRQVLHGELNDLPDHLRAPLVLCYLHGRTQDQAAAERGLRKGTLKGRLERGRELLRARLVRRGWKARSRSPCPAATWAAPVASARPATSSARPAHPRLAAAAAACVALP